MEKKKVLYISYKTLDEIDKAVYWGEGPRHRIGPYKITRAELEKLEDQIDAEMENIYQQYDF